MNSKNSIQVFEYQELKLDNANFKKHHLDAMIKFNDKNDNKYFTVIHKGIKFNSYVGVIQIGSLTIEILPKVDKDNSNSKEQKKTWQNVLLNMLRVCKKIKVENVSETALKKRYNSILDVYYEMYLNEIEQLIKKGLIKKYRRVQSNQLSLKGKLVFAKNIQKNTVHKERFYCEHQIYDKDHLLHQIIFKGLTILDSLANNHLRDKLNRILFEFQDFKSVHISKQHFDKIILNRKSLSYKNTLDIAKMLILNYSPNLNTGNDNMLTLLFNMNVLWEEYIYRILAKYKPKNYHIFAQNSKKFWENKTIRPDIVIRYKNDNSKENKVFIIDTKWKIIDAKKPSDNDLKQIFSYNLYWEAGKSMLLYPKISQKDSVFGDYHFKPELLDENRCKLGFINVLDNNIVRENKDIATEIYAKLNIV